MWKGYWELTNTFVHGCIKDPFERSADMVHCIGIIQYFTLTVLSQHILRKFIVIVDNHKIPHICVYYGTSDQGSLNTKGKSINWSLSLKQKTKKGDKQRTLKN